MGKGIGTSARWGYGWGKWYGIAFDVQDLNKEASNKNLAIAPPWGGGLSTKAWSRQRRVLLSLSVECGPPVFAQTGGFVF